MLFINRASQGITHHQPTDAQLRATGKRWHPYRWFVLPVSLVLFVMGIVLLVVLPAELMTQEQLRQHKPIKLTMLLVCLGAVCLYVSVSLCGKSLAVWHYSSWLRKQPAQHRPAVYTLPDDTIMHQDPPPPYDSLTHHKPNRAAAVYDLSGSTYSGSVDWSRSESVCTMDTTLSGASCGPDLRPVMPTLSEEAVQHDDSTKPDSTCTTGRYEQQLADSTEQKSDVDKEQPDSPRQQDSIQLSVEETSEPQRVIRDGGSDNLHTPRSHPATENHSDTEKQERIRY